MYHWKYFIKMLRDLISDILATTKGVFAGEIVNNRLNPVRLAITTTGYRIQSRMLHIPDRMGFFSSGPPRLQVHEATCFIVLVSWLCFSIISSGFLVFWVRVAGLPNHRKVGAVMSLITVSEAVLFWVMACYDRRRAPGYEWGDWKLRKE